MAVGTMILEAFETVLVSCSTVALSLPGAPVAPRGGNSSTEGPLDGGGGECMRICIEGGGIIWIGGGWP